MKFISIDIETTGLNPETCQILQIGAVIEDTDNVLPVEELPRFNCIIEHDCYVGTPTALSMNSGIFKILSGLESKTKDERIAYKKEHNIIPAGIVATSFKLWLLSNGFTTGEGNAIYINAAGKNFASFDKLFLQNLPYWTSNIKIRQRILDPAILLTDWKNDETLPNLKTCMERCSIEGDVTHDALQDAIDVVNVLRKVTGNYNFVTWI